MVLLLTFRTANPI